MKVIKTVKNLRRALGLSQQQLAKKLNVHQTLISYYERGNPVSVQLGKRIHDLACKNDFLFEIPYE